MSSVIISLCNDRNFEACFSPLDDADNYDDKKEEEIVIIWMKSVPNSELWSRSLSRVCILFNDNRLQLFVVSVVVVTVGRDVVEVVVVVAVAMVTAGRDVVVGAAVVVVAVTIAVVMVITIVVLL